MGLSPVVTYSLLGWRKCDQPQTTAGKLQKTANGFWLNPEDLEMSVEKCFANPCVLILLIYNT